MKRRVLSTAAVVFFGSAGLVPAARAAGPQASIEAINQKFGAAYEARDPSAIAALYTPKAMVFPPGQDMVQGRDAIRQFWGSTIDSGAKLADLKTNSVEQFGHAAREIGRFTLVVPSADKPPKKIAGKYLVVWKQVNGTWMLDCDIWNLNE